MAWVAFLASTLLTGESLCVCAAEADPSIVKCARFRVGDTVAYGIVEGDMIRQLKGDLFAEREVTDKVYPLAEVELLVPVEPKQVLAMAVNYKSHAPGAVLPVMHETPQPFIKGLNCLIADGQKIVIPADATDVHYEAELVIVIGKEARNVPKDKALDYVFGVTCGNDVSERVWQKADKQWWRAKGTDTFGPIGPYIVSGLDYDNLLVTLRLNGEVKQQERTSELVHSVPATVSYISKYVTLQPGDVIFTGTPGKTGPIKPGDTVEVEVEGVGTLTNKVVAAGADVN
jgi:2-keto-4-pentenoate hydratase/2-oxohepta-3-ene-1,7-dioic acid hydratase in catechol pathway